MSPEPVDLRTMIVSSPADVIAVPLDVALLQNDEEMVFLWAEVLEHLTSWHVIPFQTLEHAIAFLEKSLPHIFVTHWHLGWDHKQDNPVTQLVARLKEQRGRPGIGTGPLIVGTYRRDSGYYDQETFLPFIEQTYDCHMESLIWDMKEFINTLARELWYHLPRVKSTRPECPT